MTQIVTVIFSAVLVSTVFKHTEGSTLFNRMMGRVFATVSTCTDEIQNKISPELCLSEFDGDNNPNDEQFDSCKQAITCAAKKLNYMTQDGKWDQAKLLTLRDGLHDQEAINEFDNTFKTCSSVSGTNGEAVINMISCVLNNSDKAKQSYNELRDTFMAGYEDAK